MLIENLKEILQTTISENKSNYAHILQKKCNRDLIKQIYEYTCFLKEDCWKLSTRCYCIINDIDSLDKFPKCKTCGKTILRNVFSFNEGFITNFCCQKCAANNDSTKEKLRTIKLKKYGNIYGSIDKMKKSRLKRYGDENYHNVNKFKETVKNFSQQKKEDIIHKRELTSLKRFGTKNPAQSNIVKQKVKQSCLKKYGRTFGFDYEKVKQTNLNKLGYNWPQQSKVVHEKSIQTCIEKYGCENPMQNHEVQCKQRRLYNFDNQQFNSKQELACYIWLKEHNYVFKYANIIGIPYISNSKKYYYFPDFEVTLDNGKILLLEIKGSHFFKKDGTMFNPFRYKNWTDEQYNKSCQKYEDKHQCMLQHNVLILLDTSVQVKKYIQYVETKYGKNFWKLCRKSKQ